MAGDEEDLRFLGIYTKSGNFVFPHRKILRQTALALILPFCVVFIAHYLLLQALYHEILSQDTKISSDLPQTPYQIQTLFLKALLFVLDEAFCVLVYAAVLYTATSVHTVARELTSTRATTVVPRAWKRLIVTALCSFPYNSVLALVTALCLREYFSTLGGGGGSVRGGVFVHDRDLACRGAPGGILGVSEPRGRWWRRW